MSTPHQRGGRGEHRGGRGGGGRGGGRGGHASGEKERPKKENILDLTKYMDKQITVKFTGGREGEFLALPLGKCCLKSSNEVQPQSETTLCLFLDDILIAP